MEPKNNKMNIEPASTTDSANKKNTTSTKGNKKKVQKKHHDRKNANPKAYRFGIPSSAIFERKGSITKLVEYKGSDIKLPNMVFNASGALPNCISVRFQLKSVKNSLITSKMGTHATVSTKKYFI